MKDFHEEYLFVELADGTICSLPAWMFHPECAGFSQGPPLIAVEALVALRDLISSLHAAAECAKASLNPPPKEEVSEAVSQDAETTTQPAAVRCSDSSPSQRQATRTNRRDRRDARQRRAPKRKPSSKRKRRRIRN